MTHDRDRFAHFDPWAALADGRRQLLAALDACDAGIGGQALTIPEFAALGESTGTLSALLLAHAGRDRAHAAFFASLDAVDPSEGSDATPSASISVDATAWSAVCDEVVEARGAMLEALASLAAERWEQVIFPPWEGEGGDSLPSLLVVRAMSDGILAAAIHALLAPAGNARNA